MIWLIGNKGMLGTELSLMLREKNIDFHGTDREVDIKNAAALEDFAINIENGGRKIEWIINCAAYTAVDKAEDDRELCRALNTDGAANIAACAVKHGAGMIHISTDYVFDGSGSRPYKEDDPTNPIGVYGLTKRDGECEVLKKCPRAIIIRTAWLYGRYGGNFVATMLRLMNERDSVSVVNDQFGSPTWARDLSAVIIQIPNGGRTGPAISPGIYHFSGEGIISWYDFARGIYRIGRESGLITNDCKVKPCTSAEYPAKVTRPSYSALDKNKIKTALGIKIPQWEKSLEIYLRSCQLC